jgi:hypothetical protein
MAIAETTDKKLKLKRRETAVAGQNLKATSNSPKKVL